jgi:polar amino acid transport system substrate-binding protein
MKSLARRLGLMFALVVGNISQSASARVPCGFDPATGVCRLPMTIGVRGDAPGYSERYGQKFSGFEADLAREVGIRIAPSYQLVEVRPLTAVSRLDQQMIDIAIAGLTDTVTLRREVRLLTPHYYASASTIYGPTSLSISDEADIAGLSVCTLLGHPANRRLGELKARASYYDSNVRLIDGLIEHSCDLAIYDGAFHLEVGRRKNLVQSFEAKTAFPTRYWSIAISKEVDSQFEDRVSRLLAELHASGTLKHLAQRAGVDRPYLDDQRRVWGSLDCVAANGYPVKNCSEQPFDDEDLH